MNLKNKSILLPAAILVLGLSGTWAFAKGATTGKPDAEQAFELLKAGNARFVEGKSSHPHADTARLRQAGQEDQANHAYATVLSCSDSRVPVELIFDAGVMDVFVVRVAGNVCNVDEAGCIEYGAGHVKTPLVVVLGHTQCGAVKAVVGAQHGGAAHALEANIPPLIDSIGPAVKRAIAENPGVEDKELVGPAVRENVWQSMYNLLARSSAVREQIKSGQVRVVGAIYDVGTGKVEWMPESWVEGIMAETDTGTKTSPHGKAETAPAEVHH